MEKSSKKKGFRPWGINGKIEQSEAEVRADLAALYFSPGDVEKLCASPTFRQLMGWG